MKKLLIIHPALAPYMVDQFNALSRLYHLEVVFLFKNLWYDKFDQSKLLPLLKFKTSFLLRGPESKERVFRFNMLRTIRQIKPDIIIGYEYSYTTQYLLLLKSLGILHQEIGSIVDDNIEICHHVQSKIRYIARQLAVKRLDYLIVLSKDVSEFYQQRFGFNENQIVVSPILQDPNRLRSNKIELEKLASEYAQQHTLYGKKVLLYVGRFAHVKALPRFIHTVSELLHKHKDVVLVLVGDGDEKLQIRKMITELHLEDKIILPGRFEGDELYAWYLCASGLVLPSTYEPFGAVVNEAMIFGAKVLCSKYAGSTVLVGSDTGLTFDPLNEKDTLGKLELFLEDMEILTDVSLERRPSLMLSHEHNFRNEWNKIYKV